MALFEKKKKAIIKFAKINEKNLEVEVDEIKKLITSKTKMIAITHISNVTGGITPKKIIDLASSKNIPVLVDRVTQGAPHLLCKNLDMKNLMRFLCNFLS